MGLAVDLAGEIIEGSNVNNLTVTLAGGNTIYLKGADRPDTMRGVSLKHCVLDEYAFMKPNVWDSILRPALSDKKGSAIFISTPEGRNHFYDVYMGAYTGAWADWKAWTGFRSEPALPSPKSHDHAVAAPEERSVNCAGSPTTGDSGETSKAASRGSSEISKTT